MKFDDLVNKLLNETDASEARLDGLAKLHKLGTHMSDADSAYVVISDVLGKGQQNADDYIALGKELNGWPGDGSGEDDFADYNQMKGNDY